MPHVELASLSNFLLLYIIGQRCDRKERLAKILSQANKSPFNLISKCKEERIKGSIFVVCNLFTYEDIIKDMITKQTRKAHLRPEAPIP